MSRRVHLAGRWPPSTRSQEAVHITRRRETGARLPDALNNLAWILAANPDPQARNGRKAVELAQRACKLTGFKQPLMVGTLAAAYAEAGFYGSSSHSREGRRAG